MSRTAFFSARAIPAVAILAIALDITAEEEAPPQFIVSFTEDKNGFYINGEKFTRCVSNVACESWVISALEDC